MVIALVVLWALTQIVWLISTVGGVGFGRAWQGGAFGRVVWSVVKMGAVGAIVWASSGPLLRVVYGELIERGVVVNARIIQGPDFVLARVLGGALDVMVLDRLLGMLIPCRITNFSYEYEGVVHTHQAGFLYPDETASSGADDGAAQVLVDPGRPDARAWLIRRRS
jgi:hypothetical protein